MAKEHPLISSRRILTVAIADQLQLAREVLNPGYVLQLGRATCDIFARNANNEAGRLTARLIAIQERIEELDLD